MKDLRLARLKTERSKITINGITIGGEEIILMGGPCAVESKGQMDKAAEIVARAGGKILRGGVFKPRSSPYSFQGLGQLGLDYLVQAARAHDLLCVTEVIDAPSLELVIDKVDLIQIGSRNMQNFELLKKIGKLNKPVILKRGLSSTIEEWLLAAEYILAGGNSQVILCERGIRTFETSTRNTLDLSAIGVAKGLSHLPVIVDPSHAAGRSDLVPALSKAAIVAGADGLLIEMHPNPKEALCHGDQSLTPDEFEQLAEELTKIASSVDRRFHHCRQDDTLEALRHQIDDLDQTIVELLAARLQVVKKVADQKSLDRVKDTPRETEVLQRLGNLATKLQFSPDLVKKIYALLFEYGVQYQIKSKLAKEQELAQVYPQTSK